MVRRLVLVCLALLLAACSSGASPSPSAVPSISAGPPEPASIGRAFIDAVSRGDNAAAQALEDEAMLAAAPAAKLGELWQAIVTQYGAFQSIGRVEASEQPPYTIVSVETVFANATVPIQVTVTSGGQVGGLYLSAPQSGSSPGASESPAAYVDPAAFTESAVTVGSAPWALPGTLSMPTGPGPFPAVVLVAGSGPSDRDETFGPNKPLRDIAWGLASAGIAVLRYDKRTLTYSAPMAAQLETLTVREETIDDAVAAIDLLRSTPTIDPGRVFVVGHSLGGYLAPRIAAGVPGRLRGIAMVAAPSTRSQPQIILAQETYLLSLQGSPTPSGEQRLADLRAQVELAESPSLSPTTPASALPLGVPAAYWLDLRAYDQLATAAGLQMPMLLVQGGRDYQVPPGELDGWRGALEGRSDVTFKEYPELDHLLLAGSGPSTPDEYGVPGHVAPQLVSDLAAWILGH